MTIAFAAQVNDGIVLATDSATTMTQGDKIINIYDNANKAFNLHKSLPIGIITWGAGNMGRQSIASIVKDFRKVIMDHEEVKIDILNYSIEQVATMFFEGIKLLNINEAVKESSLGFVICGYSSESDFPERWLINFTSGGHEAPQLLADTGMELCWTIFPAQVFIPSMPIQDVIDIAEFLIQTTIKYVKYTPGNQTVGGPIEIASITKHEGFKWIKRKYYYDSKMNPMEG
jgi:hypothetical protein